MERHPFWQEECPARGALLTHTHDDEDRESPINVCSFCGVLAGYQEPAQRPLLPPVATPIDVTARMRAIGLDPAEEAPIETERDHETGMVARWVVMTMGRRSKFKLLFLKWRYDRDPEAFK